MTGFDLGITPPSMPPPGPPRRVFTEDERKIYGGDFNMLRTIPKNGRHPETGEMCYGTREEQHNSGSLVQQRSFFRGDIIYIAEPHREFAIYPHYLADPGAGSDLDTLRYIKGYEFCQASEWDLSDRMKQFWSVENGLLVQTPHQGIVVGGTLPDKWILLYCPAERFLAEERRMAADSNTITGDAQKFTQAQARTTVVETEAAEMNRGVVSTELSLESHVVRMDLDDLEVVEE